MPAILAWVAFLTIACYSSTDGQTVVNGSKLPLDSPGDSKHLIPLCKYTVLPKSVAYFHSWVETVKPHLIYFDIEFSGLRRPYLPTASSETFNSSRWLWTYATEDGMFPYLKWNLDYGLLSFGLLNAKTLKKRIALFVVVSNATECPVRFGTPKTTTLLADALLEVTKNISVGIDRQYTFGYWCFLAENPGVKETLAFKLGQYFNFPVDFARYNCCRNDYNFTTGESYTECLDNQIDKWFQCTIIPYVIGLVLFAFFPIWLFNFTSSFVEVDVRFLQYRNLNRQLSTDSSDDPDWVFLSGVSPLSLSKEIKGLFGLRRKYPNAASRIWRLLYVILCPVIIYAKIFMYYSNDEQYHSTQSIVDHGLPVGFLSILGGIKKSSASFAPALGGAMCLFVMHFFFGLVFVVVPTSIAGIINSGMSDMDRSEKSPLFWGTACMEEYLEETILTEYGYKKAALIMKARAYMVCCPSFWRDVVKVQIVRYRNIVSSYGCHMRCAGCICKALFAVVYTLLCAVEIVLLVLYFGIPLFQFFFVATKGLVKTLGSILNCSAGQSQSENLGQRILNNVSIRVLCSVLIGTSFGFYMYTTCLIFTESFIFLAQILVFCFVAVIVFPSVAFGYLFFCTILLYYIVRLFSGFGEQYLDLTADAVEVCIRMEELPCEVFVVDKKLFITRTDLDLDGISEICFKNKSLPIPSNAFSEGCANIQQQIPRKLILKNNMYGIRRDLFYYLVRKLRPVHIVLLRMLFHLGLIVLLIVATFSISHSYTQGPASEISDVMHVLFMVTVGALPRVLEVTLSNSNKTIQKEIEGRHLEELITKFYIGSETNDSQQRNERRRQFSIQDISA